MSGIESAVQCCYPYTAGTCIELSWQRSDACATFQVSDKGPGSAPEHLPRLSERFYRVYKVRSRQTGGSGLSLAIVKHALSHHDARVEVSSVPGEDTRFDFTLPARLISTPTRADNSVSPLITSG